MRQTKWMDATPAYVYNQEHGWVCGYRGLTRLVGSYRGKLQLGLLVGASVSVSMKGGDRGRYRGRGAGRKGKL